MAQEPISRADLDRAVDSLKDHINEQFDSQKRYNEVVHETFRTTLENHSGQLYGNGNNGLIKQVDRMQTSYKTVKKMLVGFFALISTIGAYLGFK